MSLVIGRLHHQQMARPSHTTKASIHAKEMRRAMTVSEARVWGAIKNKTLGVRFRRQVPIGPWIVDFCSLDPRLSIEIYDTSGRLVRSLDLGPQPAGTYLSRVKAADWDGRNSFGESVTSGVYFYVLKADSFSDVKKMVILK
jgi:hypothetical protein